MLPFWQTRPFSCHLIRLEESFQWRIPEGVDFGGIVGWLMVMLPLGRDFQAVKLEIG